MLRNHFLKNLYQSLSYFSVILIFVFFLLIGFFESLNYESNFGWLLLLIAILLIILFFIIGFYWIFQKVIINENGIKIVFINKVIRKCKWEEIESIEEALVMKNPALIIKLIDGSKIRLDKRKSIIKAIEKCSTKNNGYYFNGTL